MATSKQIRISITSALNAAGIEATKGQVDSMAKSVAKSMGDAAKANRTHWADIKAAWDMGTAAISKAWGAIRTALSSAFHFETQTNQFKTLIGNIDEARAHMADLKALGDTPPFSLDEFAKASRSLMVMTDGALGYKKSLEMIGDAAAATGYPIEEMGQAVGRLYAFIRDGQPLSRAVMQLRNMGVITPEVAQKLQDMQDAGESGVAIWDEVESALSRYNGAMKETENTGNGLIGAIQSQWNNIVRAFGQALQDDAKGGLKAVHDAAKELQEDGSVQTWAESAASALGTVASVVESVAEGVAKVINHLKEGREAIREFFGGEKEAADEETFNLDREEEVNAYTRKRYFTGSNGSERVEVIEDAEKKKEHENRLRELEEEQRKREALEEGDRKRAEKAAEELAKKKAEKAAEASRKAAEAQEKAEAKAAEKAARERERLAKQQEQEDKRREAEKTQRNIRNHQKLLAAERAEESKTRSAASAAESKLQQAWGWYRDKNSMAAQMAEEKADAQARKQFEKDFERLKDRRRDWRKAENLSVDDEAVRRVALAREEKEQAEKHLAEIERNTADLAEKLDKLLQVKG